MPCFLKVSPMPTDIHTGCRKIEERMPLSEQADVEDMRNETRKYFVQWEIWHELCEKTNLTNRLRGTVDGTDGNVDGESRCAILQA